MLSDLERLYNLETFLKSGSEWTFERASWLHLQYGDFTA
ncbi:hypothetical protein HSB1_38890 [Halogranum salarium B-1]|uniref:Uncharacterized protein n=1 Tax=Halogranum salarium B-1 TaxID=1210908 RepID=J3JDU9_9EURY|nr:hypothetical protein HSB1_38890 [Halogranum salarium B-1]